MLNSSDEKETQKKNRRAQGSQGYDFSAFKLMQLAAYQIAMLNAVKVGVSSHMCCKSGWDSGDSESAIATTTVAVCLSIARGFG